MNMISRGALFTVAIALGSALLPQSPHAQGTAAPATASIFEVTIDGIQCNQPISDGLLDHGDDVWVDWWAQMYDHSGPTGPLHTVSSAIHGHSGHPRVRYRAGTGSQEGGIWRGNVVRGQDSPPGAGLTFPLMSGVQQVLEPGRALLIVPMIWRAHGEESPNRRLDWQDHLTSRVTLAGAAMRPWVLGQETERYLLVDNATGLTRQTNWLWWNYFLPDPEGDRPIGSYDGYFIPNMVALNEHVARRHPSITLRYRDRGAHGDYTIFMSVRPHGRRDEMNNRPAPGIAPASANDTQFRRGATGALQLRVGDGEWQNAGGVLTSEPATATLPSGEALVAARGQDSAIWVTTCMRAECGGWTSIGGVLTSGPSMTAEPNGIVRVTALGQDGRPWINVFDVDKKKWSGWTPAR